jgi:hypothetical protein
MQTLLEGREYVRINVEGLKLEAPVCTDKLISVAQPQEEVREEVKEETKEQIRE